MSRCTTSGLNLDITKVLVGGVQITTGGTTGINAYPPATQVEIHFSCSFTCNNDGGNGCKLCIWGVTDDGTTISHSGPKLVDAVCGGSANELDIKTTLTIATGGSFSFKGYATTASDSGDCNYDNTHVTDAIGTVTQTIYVKAPGN